MKPEGEAPRPPEVEALLDAASRPGPVDRAAEERALHAFRTAREESAHAAPLWWRRGRDDWRPGGERRRARSLKVLVAGVVAAAALGGVAVAAGDGALPSPFGGGAEPNPGRNAPAPPGAGEEPVRDGQGGRAPQSPSKSSPSAPPEPPPQRPSTARDTAAHCRAHPSPGKSRAKAPGEEAAHRLGEATGSREAAPGRCGELPPGKRQKTGTNPAEKVPKRPETRPKRNAPTPAPPGTARAPGPR